MAPKRTSVPPMRNIDIELVQPLSSHPAASAVPANSDAILKGTLHALIPPSPELQTFGAVSQPKDQVVHKPRDRTAAGVRKHESQKFNGFRFLDLPGEIRNMIYKFTNSDPRQALLVHRPRMASLRSRTRLDRARPLASDVAVFEIEVSISRATSKHYDQHIINTGRITRYTNRPSFGLTHVCRTIRAEFRPIYLREQEIGLDLTDIPKYLEVFYPNWKNQLVALRSLSTRERDMPFMGNLTIAVGEKPNAVERCADGFDVLPLLDVWANSSRIEAGFGRYHSAFYIPEIDEEAKDLYRLFGRRVLPNRSCAVMNGLWRNILRTGALSAIRVHRQPANCHPGAVLPGLAPAQPGTSFTSEPRPYIHLIFKKEFAEPWMNKFESGTPISPDWLSEHGFSAMDHFDIRVGVQQ